ncbi:uncharacterized protein A4U43_C01F22560 [Asparagus officinalis]|uniref:Uncharacterized protein n=1 Tax=Asparagus officinalis TaxID=4686 RepID=A0A5P1FV01_ASPOF|nr:uncharacterized protein A4U43_C01F22560 [Asparagus officinalis]
MEGGFDSEEPDYEETHSIVILPDYISLPFSSVELPENLWLNLTDGMIFCTNVKIFYGIGRDRDLRVLELPRACKRAGWRSSVLVVRSDARQRGCSLISNSVAV